MDNGNNINNSTDSLLNKLKEDSVSYKNLETSSLYSSSRTAV